MYTLELIKETLGLNSYEAKIYNALLGRGVGSASELASISKVPRSRCYDVLEGLEKKGFVFSKIGKPIKYLAIAPEQVMATLKRSIKKEEERLISLFASVQESDAFAELVSLYKTGIHFVENSEIATSLAGWNDISPCLKEMLVKATSPVSIYTTKEGAKRKAKIAKKYATQPVRIYAPVAKKEQSGDITIIPSAPTLRMVACGDEHLFFTAPEKAVWLKSSLIRGLIEEMFK